MFKYLFFMSLIICCLLVSYIFFTKNHLIKENLKNKNESFIKTLAQDENPDKESLQLYNNIRSFLHKVDRIDFIYLKPIKSFKDLKFNKHNKTLSKLIEKRFTCRNIEKKELIDFFKDKNNFTSEMELNDCNLNLFAYECYVKEKVVFTIIPNITGVCLYVYQGNKLETLGITEKSLYSLIQDCFTNLMLLEIFKN